MTISTFVVELLTDLPTEFPGSNQSTTHPSVGVILAESKPLLGYLAYLPEGAIRFRIGEPDFTDIQDQEFDWSRTVYGSPKEIIPTDIPQLRGNHVTTVHCVDANLHHDLVTGRSVTAILHIVNGTPIDWYSKRQATVETAIYGSEFVTARIAVDQLVDLR